MLSPQQGDQAATREVGAERDRDLAAMAGKQDQRNADHRSDQRGKQDDQRQHLPAQPCADCGKQLEITVAHAFLFCHQLEQPVNAPQRQIARHRPDQGGVQAGEEAVEIEQQTEPDQGLGDAVRQQLGVEVDEGQCDQCPGE